MRAQVVQMEIKRTITVEVPVAKAWGILADDFHDVCVWACGVSSSKKEQETGPAGIPDRQCVVDGMGTITERVTHFDAADRTFTYEVVEGAPAMVKHVTNTWTLYPKGPHESEVRFSIDAELNPIAAFMMGWVVKGRMEAMADQLCIDLKTFVETGFASEKKLNQFARAA